jgi:SPP1 family predicted phage head-tail adaptor
MSAYALGELDERVTLVSKAETLDGIGGVTTAETVYASVWAHVRALPRGQGEARQSDRVEAAGLYLVAIRNRSDVTEKHLVRWRSRDLNIRFVRSRGPRDLYLELECELGAAV